MPVPQAISLAFERYGEAMDSARRNRRTIDGFLGIGSSGIERCQDDFVSELRAAVEGFAAAGPDSASAREALEYIFSRARAGAQGGRVLLDAPREPLARPAPRGLPEPGRRALHAGGLRGELPQARALPRAEGGHLRPEGAGEGLNIPASRAGFFRRPGSSQRADTVPRSRTPGDLRSPMRRNGKTGDRRYHSLAAKTHMRLVGARGAGQEPV